MRGVAIPPRLIACMFCPFESYWILISYEHFYNLHACTTASGTNGIFRWLEHHRIRKRGSVGRLEIWRPKKVPQVEQRAGKTEPAAVKVGRIPEEGERLTFV